MLEQSSIPIIGGGIDLVTVVGFQHLIPSSNMTLIRISLI